MDKKLLQPPARAGSSRSSSSFSELTQLDLSHLPLYGRSKEVKQLQQVHAQTCVLDAPLQAVLVHGTSGTGKSTLIDNFLESLPSNNEKKKKHCCIKGKFDQYGADKPYSAIAVALNDLCERILVESSDKEEIKESIQKAVGSEGSFLVDVIPQLSQVIGQPEAPDAAGAAATTGNNEAFNRLAYVFRAFIRAVCDKIHPLIIFLDDLQWADESSLKLIKSMITDSKSKNLLFIGSYRDNELDEHHTLTKLLDEIKDEEELAIHTIKIDNLGVDVVNEMLADLTKLDLEKAMPLAELVHQRTNGNAFFMLQFLDLLLEENLLVYSLVSFKWTWDMHNIKEKTSLSDNVVELVAAKLQRLDSDVQFVLKIAACLWSTFDVNFLEPVLLQLQQDDEPGTVRNKEDVVRLLNVAVKEGLVEKGSESRYRFSHDRIQQGAYFLIPQGQDRNLMHFRIGEIVLKLSQDYEGSKEWMMFIAVHQLNRGSSCVTEPAQFVELAELNLEVANMAISLSAFVPAANYLHSGIKALSTQDAPWANHYRLCLQLHVACAQMEFCNGHVENGKDIVDKVLSNACSLKDKLPAYFFLIDALVHKERKYEAALKIGLEVLSQLDQKFPKNGQTLRLIVDLVKTKRMLRNLINEDLVKLPAMENEDVKDAMKFIHLLVMCAFWAGKSELFALFILRMMRLTLMFGVTSDSSYAFMNYAVLLCSLGDFKEALRLGNVAIGIVDRLKAKDCRGRVLSLMYSFVNPWQNPLYDSLEPLLQAHRNGMESGDIESGINSCGLYAHAYLFCGLPLVPLEKDYRSYCKLMREYKQEATLDGNLPTWQFILNLMGRCDDPLVLTGEAMDQEAYLRVVVGKDAALQMFWLERMQIAYYFADIDLALEMAEMFGKNSQNLQCHFVFYVFIFFEGLICLEMARRTKKRKYKARLSRNIKKMTNWVKSGVVNCVHKLQLLEAEYKSLTAKKPDDLRAHYDLAINSARRVGFVQDNALACERAGVFFLNQGDSYWASMYFSDAHRLYCEWGAQGKANQLSDRYRSAFSPTDEAFSSNIKGRSRFTNRFSVIHKRLSVEEIERRSSQESIPHEFRSSGSLRSNRSSLTFSGSLTPRRSSKGAPNMGLGGRRDPQNLAIPQAIPSSESLQVSTTTTVGETG